MHLLPREIDKLLLHGAGTLAQKRLARGLRLSYPEAVALIAAVLLELIRDGRSVAALMDVGRRILGRAQVLEGVAELINDVQVEGTFEDGVKLVTVHHPIALEQGDLALALHGSFLPVPKPEAFARSAAADGQAVAKDDGAAPAVAGEVLPAEGFIELNQGRATAELVVTNGGDRPVQVGSHYPFAETNRALSFDRTQAYGLRLDIPAGTAVRFEPGERKTVRLVAIAGDRVVRGGNALASGPVTDEARAGIAAEAARRGFAHESAPVMKPSPSGTPPAGEGA